MSRSITIEDLYKIKFLSRPRISPDGESVAFVVTTIDERKHAYQSAIWLAPVAGGEAKRLTQGPGNAHSPSWSPDGCWLAFVSDREGELPPEYAKEPKKAGKGKGQIWLLPSGGGEAHQLTFMPHGAGNPVWSPDSQRIVFNAAVGPLDEETEDGKPLPKVRVIDRLVYRRDGAGFIHEHRQHLFLIGAAGGEPHQLTDGDWDDKDATWSPDGTRIAFTSNRGEDRWYIPTFDLYVLSLENNLPGELQCLTDGTQNCSSPSWSPDGSTIAFLATPKIHDGNHVELFTIPAPIMAHNAPSTTPVGADLSRPSPIARPEPRNLTAGFDGSFDGLTNSDMTNDQLMPPPAWSSDGKTLYAPAAYHGASRIYAISVDAGAGKQPPTITPGDIHVLDFSAAQAKGRIAALIENPTHVGEIYVCPMTSTGEVRRVTGFNDELFSELELSTPEYLPYRGADNWPIDGWLLKPPNFDPTKKYPLLVEIHGGPNTQYGYGFLHEMQMLAGAGYVILFTNPRGSIGYGRDFALAVQNAWAVKDSLDIMAGIDAALQKGYIDEQRLGVIGGSYGGFMTSWLVGHSDRFKAAVSDRAVNDRSSFFGSSDIGPAFTLDHVDATPWDDPDFYRRMSPITYVKNILTPLLIIHSENDLRCNIEQGEQLFAALKYLGREVLFVRFEGQSHGLSRGGHPKLRLERLSHIRAWFEQHITPGPLSTT
ncbi:MAG TPA: S9 family peptidase [Ktedonobacteraceae bacterium]|nr:S9 family peptidase [Ktedonobacteraceae bacterium]